MGDSHWVLNPTRLWIGIYIFWKVVRTHFAMAHPSLACGSRKPRRRSRQPKLLKLAEILGCEVRMQMQVL